MTQLSAGTAALALGYGLLATPVAAGVVETTADRFVTRDEVVVKAAPKAAWLELISPGGWWDDDHTWSGKAANMSITPQGGGCFCERIPEEESAARVGLAGSALDPYRRLGDVANELRAAGEADQSKQA